MSILENIMNEWSYVEVVLQLIFLFSFEGCLCISVCVIQQPLARGTGNFKKLWQKARC